MADLTPAAEELREALWGALGGDEMIPRIMGAIVEELGITEEIVRELRQMATALRDDDMHLTAAAIDSSTDRFATLLELAKHGE